LGIGANQCVVKINNRKVLDGIRESEGISDDGQWLTVMRAIDKADKFSANEIVKLLGPGRWDGGEEGRGDFTKGAGLKDSQINAIINFIGSPSEPGTSAIGVSDAATLASMRDRVGNSKIGIEGVSELEQMSKLYSDQYSGRIKIDPSVIRGLEYYTGPVYEVELLLDTKDEKGRPVRFGSVGGGGRYDGLVSRFRGEPVPATGFSIGVSRLQAALTLLGKVDTTPEFGPVVVVVMDRNEIAQYQTFVATLRGAGIRAEMYLGNPKNNLGVQFKYADRRNSPCVVIQGGDEKAKGEVQIKDLIIGAEIAGDTGNRDDYLQKQADAQFAAKESDLVEAVRKVLTRHNVNWK
ncbi:MAG: histidine--tRNA ligase, partial [Candidatus Afipia apatlaquensis]|nr:histidine--tRNA ligase [Candidatus Afipia apatlaquensis]